MIYEYKCSNCLTVFEEQEPMETRNRIQVCPKCNTITGKRIISRPNFDTGGKDGDKLARLDNNLKYKQ